jgi:hypothetical protein
MIRQSQYHNLEISEFSIDILDDTSSQYHNLEISEFSIDILDDMSITVSQLRDIRI